MELSVVAIATFIYTQSVMYLSFLSVFIVF